MDVCPSITLERLEQFQPNSYVCIIYIPQMVWEAGNLDDSHC
jgi:hypothetical protein